MSATLDDLNSFEQYIGKNWESIEEEVRSLPCSSIRILYPFSIATRDYQTDRLTIYI
jgi:hypothetical protein